MIFVCLAIAARAMQALQYVAGRPRSALRAHKELEAQAP